MKALLFSGGIESTALAWMERPDLLVFIDYGQKPGKGELRAGLSVANRLGIELKVLKADLSAFGSGSLVGKERAEGPAEYWPYRNQMLATLALMALADNQLTELLVGTVLSDRRHPDGRPEFVAAMNELTSCQANVRFLAPAMDWTSRELIERSGVPLTVLGWTFSCHTGEWACGHCSGCQKHSEVMAELGQVSATVR